MNDVLTSGYASPTFGTADMTLHGQTYTDTPRLGQQLVPTRADCLMGRVGRSQIVIGVGGYYAPRS